MNRVSTKPLRAPDDVDGAYRVVLARDPDHEIEGCELLVFGTGKGGAFHLRGSDRRIPVRDLRDVPLLRSQWRAIVDFVEAKRLWNMGDHDGEGPILMDGVFNSFEAFGPSVHPCQLAFGSAPGKRVGAVVELVIDAAARAATAFMRAGTPPRQPLPRGASRVSQAAKKKHAR
jgi:hypothetical protein